MRRGWFAVNQIPLRLGRQNDKFVEVLGGLTANERVLVKSEKKEDANHRDAGALVTMIALTVV